MVSVSGSGSGSGSGSVSVGLLLALLSPSLALYFHIGETEKKCFIEEIPDETMVIGELTC